IRGRSDPIQGPVGCDHPIPGSAAAWAACHGAGGTRPAARHLRNPCTTTTRSTGWWPRERWRGRSWQTGWAGAGQDRAGVPRPGGASAPGVPVRLPAALLALAAAAVHVADQGGVTAFGSPEWIGWGYRLIEAGGVLTALALLLPRRAWFGPAWAGWVAGVLLGAAPFAAYLASRTLGVPGDSGDVGNWGDWVGTVSLFVEAALVALSVCMVLALR